MTSIILSLILGLVFGFAGYCIIPGTGNERLMLGVLCGAFFALALFVVLELSERRMQRKLAKLEEPFAHRIRCRAMGNFQLEPEVQAGCVYVCTDGIRLSLPEKKPPVLIELPWARIQRVEFSSLCIHIVLTNGSFYRIKSVDSEKVQKALREQGKA